MVNVDQLRKLAEAASSGKWFWNSYSIIDSTAYIENDDDSEEEKDRKWDSYICDLPCVDRGDEATELGRRNAKYIEAAQPGVIIELLDELESLRSERDRIYPTLNEWVEARGKQEVQLEEKLRWLIRYSENGDKETTDGK